MEDQARDRECVFAPRVRIAVILSLFVILIATVYTNWIVSSYWPKTILACICVVVIQFVSGFQPQHPIDSTNRSILRNSVLGFLAFFIFAAREISNLDRFPADQRYEEMLKAPYLMPFLLLVASTMLGYFAGVTAFRRLHPDKAFIQISPDELREEEEAMRVVSKETGRNLLIGFLSLVPFLVMVFAFPRYGHVVMFTWAMLAFGTVSYIGGRRWHNMDPAIQKMTMAIAFLGPVTAFYGYYSGGKTQNVLHAAIFAVIIASVLIIPALLGRAAVRLRSPDIQR